MNVKEASTKWGISERRVRTLCSTGQIVGAVHNGRSWFIPNSAEKPTDGRHKDFQDLLNSIESKWQKLNNCRPLTKGEMARLYEEFAVEYTYNSNAIEGNTLTLRETDYVLRGLTIDKKPLRDHLEAVGHKEAFDYVCQLVKEHRPLTKSTICNIHHLVLANQPEDRGIFRRIPVRILGANHTPPQPYLIEPLIEQLLEQYNKSTENIVLRLAKFHIQFEAVHPFIDGNGRTGRLLVNLELMKAGYPPIDIKFTDRIKYYDAFEKYHGNENINPMAKLFAEYLNQQLTHYLSIICGL